MNILTELHVTALVSKILQNPLFSGLWSSSRSFSSLPRQPPAPSQSAAITVMAATVGAEDDFGLSSDDESAMIALLVNQNSGIKRKLDSNDNSSAKRLATATTSQYSVSNSVSYFGLFWLSKIGFLQLQMLIQIDIARCVEKGLWFQ